MYPGHRNNRIVVRIYNREHSLLWVVVVDIFTCGNVLFMSVLDPIDLQAHYCTSSSNCSSFTTNNKVQHITCIRFYLRTITLMQAHLWTNNSLLYDRDVGLHLFVHIRSI